MALSHKITKQLPCTRHMKKIQRDKKGPLFQSKAASVILMLHFTENFICTDQNLFVYIMYAIFSYQVTQVYIHECSCALHWIFQNIQFKIALRSFKLLEITM